MSMFGSNKPRISKEEWRKVRESLYSEGIHDERLRDRVEGIFRGDMESGEEHAEHGIDKKELEDGLKYMRENPKSHGLSDGQMNTVEKVLKKYL